VQERLEALQEECRALHNEVVDLKGSVRVMCRVRPELEEEVAEGWKRATACDARGTSVDVLNGRRALSWRCSLQRPLC
jgi:Microtubule binding